MWLNTHLFLLNYLWNSSFFKDCLCVMQHGLKYVKSVGSPSATLVTKRQFLILLGYGSCRFLRGHGWDASTRSLWKVCFNWLCYFKSREGEIGTGLPCGMAVPHEPICALVLMWHRPHDLGHYAENTSVQLHHFQQRETFVVQMGKGLVQKQQLPKCALAYIPSLQLSLDRSGWGLSQQSIVLHHN